MSASSNGARALDAARTLTAVHTAEYITYVREELSTEDAENRGHYVEHDKEQRQDGPVSALKYEWYHSVINYLQAYSKTFDFFIVIKFLLSVVKYCRGHKTIFFIFIVAK